MSNIRQAGVIFYARNYCYNIARALVLSNSFYAIMKKISMYHGRAQ